MKRQTNKSKWWTYNLLIFLCGNAGPGKERNAVQAKSNNPQMLLHPKVTRVVYKSDVEEKNIAGKKT